MTVTSTTWQCISRSGSPLVIFKDRMKKRLEDEKTGGRQDGAKDFHLGGGARHQRHSVCSFLSWTEINPAGVSTPTSTVTSGERWWSVCSPLMRALQLKCCNSHDRHDRLGTRLRNDIIHSWQERNPGAMTTHM